MVDALLNAAHTEDAEYLDEEHYDVPQITTTAHVRTCEFCGSSNTPTWRRGPGGKGSLCNACGIKWRLRKRNKKTEQGAGPPEKKPKSSKASPTSSRKKRAREEHDDEKEGDQRKFVSSPGLDEEINDEDYMDANRKNYYCKFCNKTWDITYFKNSQQFGAHCSNCSRKPRSDAAVPQSPSPVFYKDPSPAPTNLILILRYLQDELSDLDDEDTAAAAPSSPVTPSTPSLPTVPHLPQFAQLPLPIQTLPPLSSLALATPPLPTPSYDPLNTLRLAANECWHTAAVG